MGRLATSTCRTPGTATGRFVGGCLSVLVTTIGTPYEIDTRGGVLFLEDIGEPPYRIDRMLTHLAARRQVRRRRGGGPRHVPQLRPPDAPGS